MKRVFADQHHLGWTAGAKCVGYDQYNCNTINRR